MQAGASKLRARKNPVRRPFLISSSFQRLLKTLSIQVLAPSVADFLFDALAPLLSDFTPFGKRSEGLESQKMIRLAGQDHIYKLLIWPK
jgi:hypothetical protein